MSNLVEQTPKQIDTKLAVLWTKENQTFNHITQLKASLERRAAGSFGYNQTVEELSEYRFKLIAIRTESEPYEAEYNTRRWNRYFLVTDGGHVHRGRNCTTCYPTTHYGWLPELSGCDEKEMVAEYGETACTVCFPDAPTLWKAMGSPKGKLAREAEAARATREAKRAEAAHIKAIKAITNPDGTQLMGVSWRIETLAAAKSELLDLAGSLAHAQAGSYNWKRQDEILAAYTRIAEAIAHKLDRKVEDVKAEAEKKVSKRGY